MHSGWGRSAPAAVAVEVQLLNTPAFVKRTCIEAPAQEVFAWHWRPEALERLTPAANTVAPQAPGHGLGKSQLVKSRHLSHPNF